MDAVTIKGRVKHKVFSVGGDLSREPWSTFYQALAKGPLTTSELSAATGMTNERSRRVTADLVRGGHIKGFQLSQSRKVWYRSIDPKPVSSVYRGRDLDDEPFKIRLGEGIERLEKQLGPGVTYSLGRCDVWCQKEEDSFLTAYYWLDGALAATKGCPLCGKGLKRTHRTTWNGEVALHSVRKPALFSDTEESRYDAQ